MRYLFLFAFCLAAHFTSLAQAPGSKAPEFRGGREKLRAYLADHMTYPDTAIKNNIEGNVILQFLVDKKGRIKESHIVRDIGGTCGAELLRVVSGMPRWKPGTEDNEKITMPVTMRMIFKLGNAPHPLTAADTGNLFTISAEKLIISEYIKCGFSK